MSLNPIEIAASLRIGVVEFVAPDEIKVKIDIDAPDGIAANGGVPRAFPRINSYVLIAIDDGFLVGQVEWIQIENSPFPKRKGYQDYGLIDLPFPLRKMRINPLGILRNKTKKYEFQRGVQIFPSVGDPVFIPTDSQLKAIIQSGVKERIMIGTSPLAANAEVWVDPDRLFGRHLAVLGNTGSGKSCTVAGLIQWSLNAAKKHDNNPNARFIILDPNGEYSNAFQNFESTRIYAVNSNENIKQLEIPLWFWNSSEWCAFTQASAKTQRPTLIQALRTVRDGRNVESLTPSQDMRRFLRTLVSCIQIERTTGSPWSDFPKPKSFYEKIRKWNESGLTENDLFSDEEKESLHTLKEYIEQLVMAREQSNRNPYPHYDFTKEEIDLLLEHTRNAHSSFGGGDADIAPIDADIPRPFTGEQLILSVEANAELLKISEHVDSMLMRIRTILSDIRMKTISSETSITLEEWLNNYIGNNKINTAITIIDLSLVPAEIIHIITAVIARIIFEALQRYRKIGDSTLPTVLVMEEAHTFIKRYNDTENYDSASICCKVFEKISREGRKFGLGLVLSSQRPSELSPTVLSQCNTFLLHRISNDRDQELVNRLVPDNLRGLLRDLPSLPSQNAILLGWASELPVLVHLNYLPPERRPQSDDPDFWDVWTGAVKREIDWKAIANDWQGNEGQQTEEEE